MDRITTTDLNNMFEQFRGAYDAVIVHEPVTIDGDYFTFTGDDLVLQTGSKTYGRAFRIYLRHKNHGGLYNTMLNDYLGMTKREAYNTLSAYVSALWAARDSQDN